MDADGPSLQNDFFNQLRKDRALVAIFLANGKKLVGRIKAFDKFTVLLESHHGDQIVFKHSIATVGLARHPVEDEAGDRPAADSTTAR